VTCGWPTATSWVRGPTGAVPGSQPFFSYRKAPQAHTRRLSPMRKRVGPLSRSCSQVSRRSPHTTPREDLLCHVQIGVYYSQWKEIITCVLRKPGKPCYDIPKAYRPIALLNTISKLATSIIAEELSHIVKTHCLLPAMHFGGC